MSGEHKQGGSKTRTRTNAELERQFQGLLEVCAVLDDLGLRWFLTGGTLLGAVREGYFISWDWDVEVSVLTEEALPKKSELIENLLSHGFDMGGVDSSVSNFKVVANGFGTKYEILGMELKRKKFRERHIRQVSAHLFESQETVILGGRPFPAPSPAVRFLEEVYGDWQTPKRTAIKSEYLTPRGNRARRRFFRLWRRLGKPLQIGRPLR